MQCVAAVAEAGDEQGAGEVAVQKMWGGAGGSGSGGVCLHGGCWELPVIGSREVGSRCWWAITTTTIAARS